MQLVLFIELVQINRITLLYHFPKLSITLLQVFTTTTAASPNFSTGFIITLLTMSSDVSATSYEAFPTAWNGLIIRLSTEFSTVSATVSVTEIVVFPTTSIGLTTIVSMASEKAPAYGFDFT